MSLITRCPACGTMFKVVTDQLKVSQGWVRCGQCSDVFDASRHLQAYEPPAFAAPPPSAAPIIQPPTIDRIDQMREPVVERNTGYPANQQQQPYGSHSPDANQLPAQNFNVLSPPSLPPASFERADDSYAQHPDSVFESSQSFADSSGWTPGAGFADRFQPSMPGAKRAPNEHDSGFDPAGWKQNSDTPPAARTTQAVHAGGVNPALIYNPSHEAPASSPPGSSSPSPLQQNLLDDDEDDEATFAESSDVSFVRDARRKAFWRRPAVRVALGILSLLLVTVLLVQVAFQQRDVIAVLEPALKPALQLMCDQLNCTVGPLRRIEAVVIDSSSFSKIGPDAYRLSFALKNTSSTALAMPTLEVTLTDTQDQAVLRRVLTPAEFGASSTTLNAGTDFPGAIAMKVSAAEDNTAAASGALPALRVAGYRLLAFYP